MGDGRNFERHFFSVPLDISKMTQKIDENSDHFGDGFMMVYDGLWAIWVIFDVFCCFRRKP